MNIYTPFTQHTLALLIGILLATGASASTDIAIENAWLAEAPPVSKVMAAYMQIKNNSKQPITITKVTSPDFSSIEFHRTVHKNGTAKMFRKKRIELAPKKSLTLMPGGYHMMLFNPKRRMLSGDSSLFTFTLSNKKEFTYKIEVKNQTTFTHKH